jgi:addiction module RelE/StbE family toxin
MSRVEYAPRALQDLERLADFLLTQDPAQAHETAQLIVDAIEILRKHPEIGRRVRKSYRELVISRGRSGYLALYHYHPKTDTVTVLAVRHQREAGYQND